jgi:hypothetical protein
LRLSQSGNSHRSKNLTKVVIAKEIWARLSGHQGLNKACKEFVASVSTGQHPKRVFKPSGVDKAGDKFGPYIELCLYHHHLDASGEVLLVLQLVNDCYHGIALTTHQNYFWDSKKLWLWENRAAIDWDDCPDLLKKLTDHFGE